MDWDLMTMAAKVWESWVAGGWTMIPIGLVAIALYVSGIRLLSTLSRRVLGPVSDAQLLQWVSAPDAAPGEVREVLRYTQDDVLSLDEAANRFAEVEASRVPEIDRRLSSLNVLVGAAPLLGLLGTVLGMLVTFRAIATGGGKMVDAMARGISEALITTEMGLLVALPGMVIAYMVRRKRNEYVSLLARMESLTLRHLRPRLHGMTRVFVRSKVSATTAEEARVVVPQAEAVLAPASRTAGSEGVGVGTAGWDSADGLGGHPLPSLT